MGGSKEHIEHATETVMERNLGATQPPVNSTAGDKPANCIAESDQSVA
jgi:L-serine deaminase